ncbi:MAG TPA: hypothetical protein VFW53_10540 [Gallionella sp.]|nr:hypothetical protein [Gallionella sp.]
MYPVHDVDAILLLALSLAAKRRPAELVEIIAAADLAQCAIPAEAKWSESIYRLSAYGLICEQDGGYTLSPDAQEMMASQRKKADTPERIFALKENLADYHLKGEHAAIQIAEQKIGAAIVAHRAARAARGWLKPKPKPATDERQRPGQRKPFFTKRRKD